MDVQINLEVVWTLNKSEKEVNEFADLFLLALEEKLCIIPHRSYAEGGKALAFRYKYLIASSRQSSG